MEEFSPEETSRFKAETPERIAAVKSSDTSAFIELVKIAGLDPTQDFKYRLINNVTLIPNEDLRGYDFTGSIFENTNIQDAFVDNSSIFVRARMSKEARRTLAVKGAQVGLSRLTA